MATSSVTGLKSLQDKEQQELGTHSQGFYCQCRAQLVVTDDNNVYESNKSNITSSRARTQTYISK